MKKQNDHQFLKEMRSRIRKIYWKRKVKGRRLTSPGEDLRKLIAKHRTTSLVVPPDIEIWLVLFDEVISFWLVTWSFYKEQVEKAKIPVPNHLVCLMTLAGRVFQDMVCVRESITGGFSMQANVITRSLVEAIDVMHLLQLDPGLADEFRAVETNDEATKFWHAYCSRDKIHKKLLERWKWFFDGKDDVAISFHEQREHYLDLVGMSVHPSFPAAFSSFTDVPRNLSSQSIAHNAMGVISHMSKFSMHLIFLRVFEYGMLWVGPDAHIYKWSEGRKPKNLSKHKKMLSQGLSAVYSIVVCVNDDDKPSPFFPEFQTYWPRKKV
jgi:hypothetical protein